MKIPKVKSPSVYAQAIRRDNGTCRYCDRDILESLDAFAASALDHLKPRKTKGRDDNLWNLVTSCHVCNSLKGAWDPTNGGIVSEENFEQCIERVRDYVDSKRTGLKDTSYFRDWQEWVGELRRGNR